MGVVHPRFFCYTPDMKKNRVVILGGGFSGVACLKALAASAASNNLEITLVDGKPYHLYQPSLYEIVSAPPNISAERLRGAANIPLDDIVAGTNARFVRGHVKYWDQKEHQVYLESGTLPYDILVLALGSTSEYFGVPGAREYSWPLKSFEDAIRFRNALERELKTSHGATTVVISGGGFTGVECAGELAGLLRNLERATERTAHVMVVEGCPHLLPGLDARVSQKARARLEHLGVELRLGTLVERVTKDAVMLSSKETVQTRFVLWTSGVRACPLPGVTKDVCGVKGRLSIDPSLHLAGHEDVYAVGDVACASGPDGKPLPQTASLAIQEGRHAAETILATLQRKKSTPFVAHFEGYVIPVGGRHAFFVSPSGLIVGGFFGWLLRRFIDLNYLASVLGWRRALPRWFKATGLFTHND